MEVVVDGAPRYTWRVSTARAGYITPPGTYHPETMARRWFLRRYYNAPMPHAIFFHSCPETAGKDEDFHTSTFSAAINASCGMSTLPNWRMRFLPSFCL